MANEIDNTKKKLKRKRRITKKKTVVDSAARNAAKLKFELYCMIFLALDADWDDTQDEELGKFLSDANPFLFAGNVSAIRNIYENFCVFVGDREITVENSYKIAKEYVAFLANDAVTDSFGLLGQEQWMEGLREYLKSEHKGADE